MKQRFMRFVIRAITMPICNA